MDTFGRDGNGRAASARGPRSRRRASRLGLLMGLTLLAASGCRTEMYDQPRYEPYEASSTFTDGTSSRPLVAGTVAALPPEGLRADVRPVRTDVTDPAASAHFLQGLVDGELATTFPFEIGRQDLLRGQQRYQIYCYPCHGATGDGRGMIVLRGFPQPPAFYGKLPTADTSQAAPVYDDLRKAPVGHFYDVITNGHGVMYSYASRIAPEDRWRIIAYIRALQLSQYATAEELEATDLERINEAASGEQARLEEARR